MGLGRHSNPICRKKKLCSARLTKRQIMMIIDYDRGRDDDDDSGGVKVITTVMMAIIMTIMIA